MIQQYSEKKNAQIHAQIQQHSEMKRKCADPDYDAMVLHSICDYKGLLLLAQVMTLWIALAAASIGYIYCGLCNSRSLMLVVMWIFIAGYAPATCYCGLQHMTYATTADCHI